MMKNTLIALIIATLFSSPVSAKLRYSAHTHQKDIDTLRQDSLNWYTDNVDYNKFYFIRDGHSAEREIGILKAKSLEWYADNVDRNKFYFIRDKHSAEREVGILKEKALKWHDRNSWE